MKTIVCIKQVPVRDSQLRIDSNGRWILEDDLSFEINEPDTYALEKALQLKKRHGGEVVALCAGPARASQAIRKALAKGADRAIHIEEDDLSSFDTLGVARLLANASQPEKPDLILTGLQSDDLEYGQTGVVLAEILGLPHATIVVAVDKTDGSIRVKRELENGWFQNVEMPLPAVLTIQSGIIKLRYTTLMGTTRARTKEIKRLTVGEPGVLLTATAVIERLYTQDSKPTEILNDAKKAASKVVETPNLRSARHMTGTILVIMEQHGGTWNRMSWEALACAHQLAAQIDGTVSAAVVGQDIGALAEELARKKLYRAYAINHDLLKVYTADGFSAAIEKFIRQVNPSIVLFPHTYQVRDFAPRLATRFSQVLVSDVIGFRAEGGSPIFVRQLFQGRLRADIQPGGSAPHFASIRAGTFPTDQPEAGMARLESFTPKLESSDIRQRPEEPFQESLAALVQ